MNQNNFRECSVIKMSERFAKILIRNLRRRIKNAEIRHDFQVAQSLKEMVDAIRETMTELGHKL